MSNQALDEPAPIFKAVNGEVLWRGTWLPRDNASELLRLFDKERRDHDDWFSWNAADLHAQLVDAIREAYGNEQV